MASRSFFIQRPEDARRHVALLAKGLQKVAMVGFVAGIGCGAIALLLTRVLAAPHLQPNPTPGFREVAGMIFVTWFMTIALLVFSALYFVAGWGLSHQKDWARYTAAGTFLLKVLLCIWLGRGTATAMVVFLVIASWDLYGLWVLLSRETGLVIGSRQNQTPQLSKSPV